MSQGHYLGSVKDNQDLDPQFKSLLKHHWIEEAQHARLDGLLLKSLAARTFVMHRSARWPRDRFI